MSGARKTHDSHNNVIAELEREKEKIEEAQAEYEEKLKEESESQGRDLVLEESQVNEYNSLKEQVGKQSSQILQSLDSIKRDQKSDQDKYDNEVRKKAEVEAQIKQKTSELEENTRRLDKLNEYIR